MDLNINIDPEQINKLVAEAVLNSAIGEQVKKQVQKNVDELGNNYNNPIDGVIKKHINDLILKCLMTEHAEMLKTKVHEAVSGKITDEFVNSELKRFRAGLGKIEICGCPACRAAIELYGEKAKKVMDAEWRNL